MFNLINSVVNAVKSALGKLISKPAMQKAAQIAKIVGQLMQYAIPAVEMIAAMTPNRTDDEIVAVLKSVAIPVPDDYTSGRPFSEVEKNGLLLQAAREALAGHLDVAILDAGGAGLKLADDLIVKNSKSLPASILDQAVQSAYTLFVSASASTLVGGSK